SNNSSNVVGNCGVVSRSATSTKADSWTSSTITNPMAESKGSTHAASRSQPFSLRMRGLGGSTGMFLAPCYLAYQNEVIPMKTIRNLLPLFLVGCATGAPSGVEPVTGFEVDRYLGTWYEIARLDHRFERGLTDVTAEYSLNDDGTIRVINRGWNP